MARGLRDRRLRGRGAAVAAARPTPRRWPRYGSDRPDRRFGLELHDVGELVRGCEFQVFAGVLDGGGVVRALNAGARELSRSELDGLNESSSATAPKAVAPIGRRRRRRGAATSPSSSRPSTIGAVNAELDAHDGDLLLFVADREAVATQRARRAAARAGGALRPDRPRAPRRPLGRRLPDVRVRRGAGALHRDAPPVHRAGARGGSGRGRLLRSGALLSRAYDLVVDGAELGGGSIRIHTPEMQEQVFEAIGLSAEEAQSALRLPARRAALRRAAARRHRPRHRPHRRDPRRDATRSAT